MAGIVSVTPIRQILVVSRDDEHVREIRRQLTEIGARVTVVPTSDDALVQLEVADWDAVFLDCRPQEADGLLCRIQSRGSPPPTVVVTDAASVDIALDALRSGATDVLVKPASDLALRVCLIKIERFRLQDLDRLTDRTPDQGGSSSGRTTRLARAVVHVRGSPGDVRTIKAFCLLGGLFVAERTYRHWCHSEGVRPTALVDLARVLRAHELARTCGRRPVEYLDGDERSLRALYRRGGLTASCASRTSSRRELMALQRFVVSLRMCEALNTELNRET
jgi:DNA-binding response OmpR family regulator